MRGKAVHLFAAIAEGLRFLAVVFLGFSVGALLNASVSNLLRYAAVPQLLFAAGFFFMWLDPARYSSYRPLLAIGKASSAVCFLPLAAALVRDPMAMGSTFGISYLGVALALILVVVDVSSLFILALGAPRASGAGSPGPSDPPERAGSGFGQSPDDIERVEAP